MARRANRLLPFSRLLEADPDVRRWRRAIERILSSTTNLTTPIPTQSGELLSAAEYRRRFEGDRAFAEREVLGILRETGTDSVSFCE